MLCSFQHIPSAAVVVFYFFCGLSLRIGALGVGSYTADALLLLPFDWSFDNNVRSLTIVPGYKVTLFDLGSLSGRNITLTQHVNCLSAYNFNDVTSSLIIERGRTHCSTRLSTLAQYISTVH
jgi:hypothetical protein